MVQLSNKSVMGTSFYGVTISTTVNQLTSKLGKPHYDVNDGEDKVNFEWFCENSEGEVFTIYDWKQYRPIGINEIIEFHIGAKTKEISGKAYYELKKLGI